MALRPILFLWGEEFDTCLAHHQKTYTQSPRMQRFWWFWLCCRRSLRWDDLIFCQRSFLSQFLWVKSERQWFSEGRDISKTSDIHLKNTSDICWAFLHFINGFPKATAKDVMQQLDKTQRLLEKHGDLTEFRSTTYIWSMHPKDSHPAD